MLRRDLFVVLFALMTVSSVGVGQENQTNKFIVTCSTTQVADFTREIVGDRWEVRCILAAGQDPHTYETKPGDTKMVANADLIVRNGWHLEGHEWMMNLAKDANKPVVTCIDGVKSLVLEGDGVDVKDPHAWLSPINASIYVRNIAKGVSQIDPEHRGEYEARAELYIAQLRTLHLWVQREFNKIPRSQRVLISHHDAFNYFCALYGFQAASPGGWSTGNEIGAGITAERRQKVVDTIRSYNVKAIFVETTINPKLVRQIAADAGVKVAGSLYADSMGGPGTAAESYIGMMRENVIMIVNGLK
jgi:manganese/iron transport system substrate-binding protein